ncbi:ABC transporter ATP-binding protein [Enterovirga aerilata]|uniref:ATP-binding cassette domain-containing protein n=1 Tax=Enterovirga aerilata TaxID=2730920 RepID=A0A849IJT0_9HYPH|nr:ATP-binding cassette domain-containing protein [Enterovirga sp. DB1703]NNM74193.1 ATP-binding cassette domain-containing protein [Enterovirga sp. DB1703]
MIRLEDIEKRFPGQARPAVDGIELEVPAGETCVLIGPSGCGKTTTLRMVNRLIEPSAGRILVEGEDIAGADPVRLRRRIGYVIQGVGLFPHLTVGDNVATVPRLLAWPASRVAARVDEMLSLVGLEPGEFRDRRPGSLSGGQRQRVGVARALAADPPVMLMDEPFGAVDPVVRARLQRDVAEILRRLGKTVLMVTHDIDEAVRMGDRVAIMRDGRIVQCDRPERLLAAPAEPFVADFVGADRGLKRLALIPVGEAASPRSAPAGSPTVDGGASLQAALAAMLAAGAEAAAVAGPDGSAIGSVTLAAIRERARTPPAAQSPAKTGCSLATKAR